MNAMGSIFALITLAQTASAEADRLARLNRSCSIVHQAYSALMLAVMVEGPMDCGDPENGEFIDCDADDTTEERARQARRIRQWQQAAFKAASEACESWAADRQAPHLQEAVESRLREAQQIGTNLPPEARD